MKQDKSYSRQTRKIQIKVDDHLLIPFGCESWKIEKIKVRRVSTEATYFESETPCVYINKTKKVPLTLRSFQRVLPKEFPQMAMEDHQKAYSFIKEHIKNYTDDKTPFENRFLDLYFKYCQEALTTRRDSWFQWYTKVRNNPNHYKQYSNLTGNEPFSLFDALLPLPQAHLYLWDPLDHASFTPPYMVKIDFAYWTGEKIIAVEIDSSNQVSSEKLQRDRRLQRSRVSVVHILNSELMEYGTRTIERLLPKEITEYWWNVPEIDCFWDLHPFTF